MVNAKNDRMIFVRRLLEQSNDVEKNPGPPKVIKSGLVPAGASKIKMASENKSDNKTATSQKDATSKQAAAVDDGLSPVAVIDLEGLRAVVERQAEIIRVQKAELEAVRKQMEKNLQVSQDFQSEMSEIRKNWLTICDSKNPTELPGNNNQSGIASKLEALASAYNDIQDRLYEIDKSWKNNLMIYGVPCAENIEEDTVITEEKVRGTSIFPIPFYLDI